MTGRTLDHYEVLELLGEGGMGRVYKARDTRLLRLVAIKILPPGKPVTKERRRRFLREARAASALNHPGIVTVHEISRDGATDFIVMEYVAGESLDRRIPKGGLRWRQAVGLALKVADAVAAAHVANIVHRDLKPLNVMIADDGRVKLLDFGIAKLDPDADDAITSVTLTRPETDLGFGGTPGTLAYMSPEQLLGESLDGRSDIFSFGVVLYEMLTGERPIRAADQAAFCHQLIHGQPPPIHDARPDVPAPLAALVESCLQRQRGDRPQTMAEVVAALGRIGQSKLVPATDATTTATAPLAPEEAAPAALRVWPPPELPELPYPVLLPYTHPELMAGREREVAELELLLRRPMPVLGLSAPSGTGKSSLLLGGLVPRLRSQGTAVAVDRFPGEPGILGRLLGDLLDKDHRFPRSDYQWKDFRTRLTEVEALSGALPVLILDHFESVLRTDASRARAVLGPLLAASVRGRPGTDEPLCHWLLAYRQDAYGEILAWLGDVLHDARSAGVEDIDTLPRNLAGHERFHSMTLMPLATPTPGSDPLAEAQQVFQDALEKPLAATSPEGTEYYQWRFAPGHAERLARAFAEARLARPEAPLTPELQVMLARSLSGAGDDGILEVPEDVDRWIDEALDEHLRQALEAAFPGGEPAVAVRRARALLALRELATTSGPQTDDGRDQGLPAAALAGAIGDDGDHILEQLAMPLTRLVVPRDAADGLRYILSHQRLAAAVVRLVEEEGRRGGLLVDTELVALRRLVTLKTALHRSRARQATRLPRRHFRRISAHAEALLWDDERRAWWTACRRHRRLQRLRSAGLAVAALFLFVVVASAAWNRARRAWELRTLPEQIVHGEPRAALWAIEELAMRYGRDPAELLALLRRRAQPADVLEHGPHGLTDDALDRWLLRFVEMVLPWVEDTPEDVVLVADLAHRLDFLPSKDPRLLLQARGLRERLLEPLRRLRPPPAGAPAVDDPDWVEIPSGTVRAVLGGYEERGRKQEVQVPAFRILRHEATVGELRRLWPSFGDGAAENLPASSLTWYQAYTYAAWLGGRLPTEAEWVYAARAGCPYDYCREDGEEATLDEVAWWAGNSRDPRTGVPMHQPVMRLAANPWGLYDMLGNAFEWTADRIYPGVRSVRGDGPGGHLLDSGVEARKIWPADVPACGLRVVYPDLNLPPAVRLTAPLPGTALPSGSEVTVAAEAYDVDGTIAAVDFSIYRGDREPRRLGEDATEPYAATWGEVTDGCWTFRAEAVDDDGRKAFDEAGVVVGSCPQTPYGRDPLPIPGTIEAEDFDLGANGDAYFDDTPGNAGGEYRAFTDVDLRSTLDSGGGVRVGWTGPGEWLEYTVDVAAAGEYDLYVRVASEATGGRFHVEFDGVDKTGMMTAPATGDWETWETISTTVRLDQGVQVMRWQNAQTADTFDLNHFHLFPAGSSFCGDGVCDTDEDCTSCRSDCAGVSEGWPVLRHCCGNGVAEAAEGDGSLCDGNY